MWLTVTSATPRSVSNIARMLGEPVDEYRTAEAQAARKDRLNILLEVDRRAHRR